MEKTVIDAELVFEGNSSLQAPFEDKEGSLYFTSQNGNIIKIKNEEATIEFNLEGSPSGLALDEAGQTFFIADQAQQGVIIRVLEGNQERKGSLIKKFEGVMLLGPHSLVMSKNSKVLFFTDCGPFGETSISNSKGSVFQLDLDAFIKISPLTLRSLAQPTGLCLSREENILYVCETGKNRILRFVQSPIGVYYFSVFHQFSGGYGPMAISISDQDLLYTARFQFKKFTNDGLITVLNQKGEQIRNICVPNFPQMNGMIFSKKDKRTLYITDNTESPVCICVKVPEEDVEKVEVQEVENNEEEGDEEEQQEIQEIEVKQ